MKNKALRALEPLIGEYEYTIYNAWFLESLNSMVKGFATIERLHDSFIVMRSTGADKKPDDIWVIGYSDPQEKYQAFSYDQRGVARIFDVTFKDKKFIFSREDNDFYQRINIEITDVGLHFIPEASEDQGKTWRKDFDMVYLRIKDL